MYWIGVGHRVLRNVYFWGVHFNSRHIWTPNFEWLQMKWNMISCYNSLPPNRYHCLRVDWVIREGLMLTMFTTKMILTCVATEGRSHDNVVNNDNVVNINNVDNLSPPATLFKLKKGLFLTFRMGTSNARNKNLRPLFNTNIPPISGKYGLRNHFWSLESGFLMRKREENDFFSKSAKLPILSFWILNVHIIICQFQKRSTVIHFFFSQSMLLPLVV